MLHPPVGDDAVPGGPRQPAVDLAALGLLAAPALVRGAAAGAGAVQQVAVVTAVRDHGLRTAGGGH